MEQAAAELRRQGRVVDFFLAAGSPDSSSTTGFPPGEIWTAQPLDEHGGRWRPISTGRAVEPDADGDQGRFRAWLALNLGEAEVCSVPILPEMAYDQRLLPDFVDLGVTSFCILRQDLQQLTPAMRDIVRAGFDAGFVPIGNGRTDAGLVVFIRSDQVTNVRGMGLPGAGRVSMSSLGSNGRFANQIFQYCYLQFYALRHCLVPSIPNWDGADLFGLHTASLVEAPLPEMRFYAFDDDDLALWDLKEPIVDVDLWGYFQELPSCWEHHRGLVRRMFSLRAELNRKIDRIFHEITDGGRRPLVSIHLRRGDYVWVHREGLPWYTPIPEEWYIAWLDRLLPGLENPVLFIATDEPDMVAAKFARFNPILGRELCHDQGLPGHVLDFDMLRRASYQAICNSSFSRLAAILADDPQLCVIPDPALHSFVPYEPWSDRSFWSRYADGKKAEASFGYDSPAHIARSIMIRRDRGFLKAQVIHLDAQVTHLDAQVIHLERERKLLTSQLAQAHTNGDLRVDYLRAALNAQIVATNTVNTSLEECRSELAKAHMDLGNSRAELAMSRGELAHELHLKAMPQQLPVVSIADYIKLVVFWPIAWLFRKTAYSITNISPRAASKLHSGATLIALRQYSAFVRRLSGILLRAPLTFRRRLAVRIGGRDRPNLEVPVALAEPSSSAPATARKPGTHFQREALSLRAISVIYEGPASSPVATALDEQSLKPLDVVRASPDALLPALAATIGDIVCLISSDADIDSTFLEVAASALLAAPQAKALYVAFERPRATAAHTGSNAGASLPPIGAILLPRQMFPAAQRALASGESAGSGVSGLAAKLCVDLDEGPGQQVIISRLRNADDTTRSLPAWTFQGRIASPTNHELWNSGNVDAALDLMRTIGSSKRFLDRPCLLVVLPWLIHGGSEVLFFDILSKLHLTWRIVIVTTLPARHVMADQFRSVAMHIYHLGDIFDPIRTQAFIAGLISAFDAKVVVSSNSALHYEALPELKALAPASKFFDILHNDLPYGYIRSAVRASTSLTSHIAISRRIERSLVARGIPNERITVIENGIDTSLFRPSEAGPAAARAAFGITPEVIHLVFVGRLSGEKRASAFLDIVDLVRAELPTVATLIGDGPEREEIEDRIKAEGLPITLKPRMDRPDLVELYRAADILVMTSTVEGMPLVALEALASGCPVASTDVGDLRRILVPGQNGFLVPVDEPEQLAGLIVQSAKSADGHLKWMREKARVTVQQAGMDRQLMQDKYRDLLAGTLAMPAHLP